LIGNRRNGGQCGEWNRREVAPPTENNKTGESKGGIKFRKESMMEGVFSASFFRLEFAASSITGWCPIV